MNKEDKKVLHLTLKRKWFDMIASGEKKEEYREIKPYWWNRLVKCGQINDADDNELPKDKWDMKMAKDFDVVRFKNGYSKDAPEMDVECDGIQLDYGMMTWGAQQDTRYFIIQLGKILSTKNF